jgi:TRAP-type mannitol/chloroaromatic compound transport system substrate-binding protein
MKQVWKGIFTAIVALMFASAASAQQSAQKVRLNMASAFPGSLTLLGTTAVNLPKKIARASGGTIELKFHEPGALVPALQAIDATSQGSVDAAWSNAGFFAGKDPTFNIFATVPFGPNVGEFLAWMYYGGGLELARELFGKYNVHNIPCGIIPAEASGWFRKEIKTVEDLKGLKMRFYGLGAKVMAKLGVATQLLAPGDIFQALQLGTIDATEFSSPAMDLKFGFYQVAKFYYFPGWHQQTTFLDLYINKKKWESLSDTHKAVLELACGDNVRDMIAEGEAIQWKAIKEMQEKGGVQVKTWPKEILVAMEKAWGEVVAEESKSPTFQKVWASYTQFRKDYAIWKDLGYLK